MLWREAFYTCWERTTANSSVGKHRMRGKNRWVWTELQKQTESNLHVVLGAQACTAWGCHGSGINPAAGFLTEIFSWETRRKPFRTLFPKFWKRILQVFYCYPWFVIRKANTEWDGSLMQKPLHITKCLYPPHSSRSCLILYTLRMKPLLLRSALTTLGSSCSLVKFSPAASAYLHPFPFITWDTDCLPQHLFGVLGCAEGQDTWSAARSHS